MRTYIYGDVPNMLRIYVTEMCSSHDHLPYVLMGTKVYPTFARCTLERIRNAASPKLVTWAC